MRSVLFKPLFFPNCFVYTIQKAQTNFNVQKLPETFKIHLQFEFVQNCFQFSDAQHLILNISYWVLSLSRETFNESILYIF